MKLQIKGIDEQTLAFFYARLPEIMESVQAVEKYYSEVSTEEQSSTIASDHACTEAVGSPSSHISQTKRPAKKQKRWGLLRWNKGLRANIHNKSSLH
jgi:hypothetical protein